MIALYKKIFVAYKKYFLPKTLLARMLTIIIVPTVLAQIISTYIFYDRHWDKVTKYIIYTLSNEISLIANTFEHIPNKEQMQINKYTFLRYKLSTQNIKEQSEPNLLGEEVKILKRNIEYNLPGKIINMSYDKKSKELIIKVGGIANKTLVFYINHKKISTESTYNFIFWMVLSTLVLLIITILFAKNQIKSITRLSSIADRISKGQKVTRFIPNGAIEVKNAGYAFLRMKETIEDEVKRKSQMLAWVSHDLRTPLTRMKLQLALFDSQKSQLLSLKQDIRAMEAIINDYLNFIKGEHRCVTQRTNLSKTLQTVTELASAGSNVEIILKAPNDLFANVNENQIKRALFNLIDNAKRFANKIYLTLEKIENKIIIRIEDNGPGLTTQQIKQVFKPFYQTTESITNHPKGAGLGMPIAQNIIKSHGGSIELFKSKYSGLGILITL